MFKNIVIGAQKVNTRLMNTDNWTQVRKRYFQEQRLIKVRQSRKQIMVSSILPNNECWDNFQYIKLSQRSFFGRIEDTINCFRDLLTFKLVEWGMAPFFATVPIFHWWMCILNAEFLFANTYLCTSKALASF